MLKSQGTEEYQTQMRFPLKKKPLPKSWYLTPTESTRYSSASLYSLSSLLLCLQDTIQQFKINSNRCIPALKLHRKILPVVSIPFCHTAAVEPFEMIFQATRERLKALCVCSAQFFRYLHWRMSQQVINFFFYWLSRQKQKMICLSSILYPTWLNDSGGTTGLHPKQRV